MKQDTTKHSSPQSGDPVGAFGTRLSRRDALKTGVATLGGLVIGFSVPTRQRWAHAADAAAKPLAPNAFLRIGTDDTVTVLLAHSEMGQGIWTSLPMLIAEELDADWTKIAVEHAPAAPAYNHTIYGMMATGGSTSIRSEFERYRQAGAAARALLVKAAAKKFRVSARRVSIENGEAIAGKKRARFGELVDAASKLPTPKAKSLKLKDPKEWKIIGKSTKRLDTPEKTTGRATFGIDVKIDGMLTAVVARPPVFGGKVASFDATAAKAVPGVRHVVQVSSGVAVVADHFWAAKRGRDALQIKWDLGSGAALDSAAQRAEFEKLSQKPGLPAAKAGSVAEGLGKAAKTIDATYAVPYLAHAPMEPLNCVVRVSAGKCEIWGGIQMQGMSQMVAAQILGITPDKVEVNTMFLGGGFGRRAPLNADYIAEAVQVAKAAGAPVKTIWTREDDIRGGNYRASFVHRARVGLDASGMPLAWEQVLVGQSIALGSAVEKMMVHEGVDHSSVEGAADSPYLKAVPNHHVSLHSPKTTVPVLWWRSVGNSHSAFVMESLIDELSHAAGKDPVEYRRALLKESPRHLGVLNLAASKAGWGQKPPDGRARGMAVHASFGSFVAEVAEVSVTGGKVRVHRVVCAIDCGTAVNPDNIRAQIESAVVWGLSAALHGKLTFKGGKVQESNFHDYRIMRMNEMPEIEVHIVPSNEQMGGVGEPGVPPAAPAVANAVFALTGQRLRELPLTPKA